jgi:hypothetical protein
MAIAGGVLLSTVISFYFVPPAFALVVRSGRLPSQQRGGEETRGAIKVDAIRHGNAAGNGLPSAAE